MPLPVAFTVFDLLPAMKRSSQTCARRSRHHLRNTRWLVFGPWRKLEPGWRAMVICTQDEMTRHGGRKNFLQSQRRGTSAFFGQPYGGSWRLQRVVCELADRFRPHLCLELSPNK
jgi:hypothetical protein